MKARFGFTLIELSIVLVIIGLIIGAIFVGHDLIEAAGVRSQISQIEKFDAAANTFRTKYNYLPGDIPAAQASEAGLIARGGGDGDGDGNGNISGIGNPYQLSGETVFFWTDLSAAGLIDGSFTDDSDAVITTTTESDIARYLPRAAIGRGYVMAYGGGEEFAADGTFLIPAPLENNYQLVERILVDIGVPSIAGGPLTPLQAHAIDSKIDDGLPVSGKVQGMVYTNDLSENAPVGLSLYDYVVNGVFPTSYYTDCAADTTPITYNTADTAKANADICSLKIKAGF